MPRAGCVSSNGVRRGAEARDASVENLRVSGGTSTGVPGGDLEHEAGEIHDHGEACQLRISRHIYG